MPLTLAFAPALAPDLTAAFFIPDLATVFRALCDAAFLFALFFTPPARAGFLPAFDAVFPAPDFAAVRVAVNFFVPAAAVFFFAPLAFRAAALLSARAFPRLAASRAASLSF